MFTKTNFTSSQLEELVKTHNNDTPYGKYGLKTGYGIFEYKASHTWETH